MPMKTSAPGSVPVTSNRAVPRAEETGTQSAPVDRSRRSLVRAKPSVRKVSASDTRYPSDVRCELSVQSSAAPPASRPRPGSSRTMPSTRATMRPAPQPRDGTCWTGAGGGVAVMAYLRATAGTAGPRLAPADLDEPGTPQARIGGKPTPSRARRAPPSAGLTQGRDPARLPPAMTVEFGVLGGVWATGDGAPVDLGGHRQRSVVARLLPSRGAVVPADLLVADLWYAETPPRAQAALQAHISHLRRALEPDRPPRTPARLLLTVPPGY